MGALENMLRRLGIGVIKVVMFPILPRGPPVEFWVFGQILQAFALFRFAEVKPNFEMNGSIQSQHFLKSLDFLAFGLTPFGSAFPLCTGCDGIGVHPSEPNAQASPWWKGAPITPLIGSL